MGEPREDTEVIDFVAPPGDDFLLGGKPAQLAPSSHARDGGLSVLPHSEEATLPGCWAYSDSNRRIRARANRLDLRDN